jgi:succinate dehydrogenase flavin-adding protein (antitoxin of CptAB toxin-antitoxin module)
MKELDLLLERWLRTRYEGASAAQRAGFEALLELPDPQLQQYLLGAQVPVDAGIAQAVEGVLAGGGIMSHQMSQLAAEPSGSKPL